MTDLRERDHTRRTKTPFLGPASRLAQTALLTYIDEENNAAILAWILSRGLVDVGEHTNVRTACSSGLRSCGPPLSAELVSCPSHSVREATAV